MTHNLLHIFIQVAESGSFTKAAEKLYFTPPAIMKQMNQLENALGFPLFERANQGIQLTPAGESFYMDAKMIIKMYDEAVQRAQNTLTAENYVIRVGSSMLYPCKDFMPLWRSIVKAYPQFKIQIIPFDDNHENILDIIADMGKSFDILIGPCDSKRYFNHCNFYPLGEHQICLTLSSNHKLAQKKKLTYEDLYGERLLLVKKGDTIIIDTIRKDIETHHPKIQIEDVPYFYDIGLFNLCARTDSILQSLDIWSELHPATVTLPVDWKYTMPFGILYSQNPSTGIAKLIDVIKTLY